MTPPDQAEPPRAPDLPLLPRDAEGPVFRAPWEAQAFAMAVRLHEAGAFTWREWADHLAAAITRAQQRGDPDLGTTYYEHWLAALETLLAEKGLVAPEDLARRKAEWKQVVHETPPGQPLVLRRE